MPSVYQIDILLDVQRIKPLIAVSQNIDRSVFDYALIVRLSGITTPFTRRKSPFELNKETLYSQCATRLSSNSELGVMLRTFWVVVITT